MKLPGCLWKREESSASNCWLQYFPWIWRAFIRFRPQLSQRHCCCRGFLATAQRTVFLAVHGRTSNLSPSGTHGRVSHESTPSRHTAFIIIRRQERFEASWSSSRQAEQASRGLMGHYGFCCKLRNVQAHWWRKRRSQAFHREGVLRSPGLQIYTVQRSWVLSKIDVPLHMNALTDVYRVAIHYYSKALASIYLLYYYIIVIK